MKRLLRIFIPFFVLGLVLFILIDFRHVETLSAEEKQAIERYRQELIKGTLLNDNTDEGIFYQQDFDVIAKSLHRLHEDEHYHVFGPQWGTKIPDKNAEFAKITAIINKKEYTSDLKHQDFFAALKADLAEAQKKYGTRESHDILDDLATLVFTKKIYDERQWGETKTIQLMKEKGLKLIKEQPEPNKGTSNAGS